MIESAEPYFLLGTHRYHPNKFLLISVINMSSQAKTEMELIIDFFPALRIDHPKIHRT